ncbi:MAG TPA: glycerophosphodiester phosphodiesterase [Acidimicrobiales bacterium]|jgi:glycerophosphoryl diester phosphodiesterase
MPIVIAHRGASAAAPENTVEAFRLAAELGADWVELDARRTADGAIVVAHDAHLPDGRAIVDLKRADLPRGICDLDEALDACAGMGVNIEIKNVPVDPDHDERQRVAIAVVAELARRGAEAPPVIVSSFSRPTIDRIFELDGNVPTAYLFFARPDDLPALAQSVSHGGHDALHPWDGLVDAELVAAAHDEGLAVNVWTVDDPARMADLLALGVDGLCTNVPDIARHVVGDPR